MYYEARHVHAGYFQAHFLHRSHALLTLLLSFSSLLLFAVAILRSPEPALFAMAVAVASMLLVDVHVDDPCLELLLGEHP